MTKFVANFELALVLSGFSFQSYLLESSGDGFLILRIVAKYRVILLLKFDSSSKGFPRHILH